MFGYVRPYITDLSEAEQQRYRSVYCGLCRSLGRRYGALTRFSVNFDMTFLALMLSSLYEPEETVSSARCAPHPFKPHREISSSIVDYAADLTVALTYYKCLDDWADEKKHVQKLYGDHLKKSYDRVKAAWPHQCQTLEEGLAAISYIEKHASASQPDAAVNCFGRIMAELFIWKEDFWAQQLRWFGASLGRFIYLMDAAMDYEQDQKKACYNPLLRMNLLPEKTRELLMQPLGEASEAFEKLPLIQDQHLMQNILYSGVWQDYNEKMKKHTEGNANGQ